MDQELADTALLMCRADAEYALTGSQHCTAWNDVMATIWKSDIVSEIWLLSAFNSFVFIFIYYVLRIYLTSLPDFVPLWFEMT